VHARAALRLEAFAAVELGGGAPADVGDRRRGRLRHLLGVRPLRRPWSRPDHRRVRGLDHAGGDGAGDQPRAHRHIGHRELAPAPWDARQDGGERRSPLRRPAGAGHRRRWRRDGARHVRPAARLGQGADRGVGRGLPDPRAAVDRTARVVQRPALPGRRSGRQSQAGAASAAPLWVASSGERRGLRVVAEHADVWINANQPGEDPAELARLGGVLDRHCEAIGRDPDTIRRAVQLRCPTTRTRRCEQSSATCAPGSPRWS
jgi:hypothetical protein